jgi:putative hydrolase of the HAD superfamily
MSTPRGAGDGEGSGTLIRLVTLDFWHTLFADTPNGLRRAHALRLEGVRAALAEDGRVYEAADVAAADAKAGEALATVWREHRDMASDEQIRVFLAALDPALAGALGVSALGRVARAYQEPALAHRPEITPGAVEAVRELKARGLLLGLVSNTGRTPGRVLRQLLASAGLLHCFDVLVFSDEAGVRKPASAIFRRVLDHVRIDAAAGVHVGDDASADVAGARGAGMRAIHFVPADGPAAPDGAVLREFAQLPALVARLG